MNVLSLFDGISCGKVAAEKAAKKAIGNGWNIETIAHIMKHI